MFFFSPSRRSISFKRIVCSMLKIPLVGFDYEVEGGVEIATKKKKKTRRREAERQAGDPTTTKKNVTSARAVSSPTGAGGRRRGGRGRAESVITRRTREPRRRTGLEPSLVGVCATRKYREREKKRRSQTETHTHRSSPSSSSDCPFLIFPRRGVAKPPTTTTSRLQALAPCSMWAPPGPDAEQPQTGAASKTELERILSSHLQQQQQQQQHSSAPLSGANGSFADPLGPGLSLESLMQLQQHQAASASGGFPNDLASLAALHQPQLPPISHKVKVACENCEVLLEVEVPANHPAPSMIVR